MQHPKRHIPVLDGIRGLAIIMVLIAHFTTIIENYLKECFPLAGPIFTKLALSGLMGVDLFFVLSGFLITGILLDTKSTNGFFRNFYARRFLRIFPLYYGVLFTLFCILPKIIAFDAAANEMADHQWWLWAYLTNFPGHPAWDNSTVFKLGHFWSLAVEEHFYFVWPFVVYFVPNRLLKKICTFWVPFSIMAGVLSRVTDWEIAQFLGWSTVSFSGGLMLGAYCALVAREENGLESLIPYAQKMIVVFGLLFLVISMVPRHVHLDLAIHYVSWFFFFSIIVLTVSSSRDGGGFLVKFFNLRIMRLFGKVSYGLYVYHFVVLPLLEKYFQPDAWGHFVGSPVVVVAIFFMITIGSTFLISWISWQLYEKQFLKLKRFFEPDLRAEAAVV
jgi:peptidoglycan/LPS O-acetylase OafA/YrhL